MAKQKSSDSPGTDDALGSRPHAVAAEPGRFARRIDRYLAALYLTGDDAGELHDQALAELTREPEETGIALARAEGACNRRDYPKRWALVYAATRLDHEAAVPYLRQLVLRPIPPRDRRDSHGLSAAREETILRTTAIDGLGRLASRGNKRALDALFECLDIASISIRRTSIQAILSAKPDYRKRIVERLPANFRYLLDVKRTEVTKVPQVKDPRKHLREHRPADKAAPPRFNAEPDKPKKSRSPKVGKKKPRSPKGGKKR